MLKEEAEHGGGLVIEKSRAAPTSLSAKGLNTNCSESSKSTDLPDRSLHRQGEGRKSWCCRFDNGMFRADLEPQHIDHMPDPVREDRAATAAVSTTPRAPARHGGRNILFSVVGASGEEPPAEFDAHAVRSGKRTKYGGDPAPERGGGLRNIPCAASIRAARSTTRNTQL